MALRTNSKEVMKKIEARIIDSYNNSEEYFGFEGRKMATDYNNICKDVLGAFENEKLKFDNRYNAGRISKQDLFIDWMQGLPTAFNIADDIFLGDALDYLGELLEQSESEKAKYTTEQAEKNACYLFYRELTKHASKAI